MISQGNIPITDPAGHYEGGNLVLWILFTVVLFASGTYFLIRALRSEVAAQKKTEVGHALFCYLYGVARIFFIFAFHLNGGWDYDLYCSIAYTFGMAGYTSLVIVMERYLLERKPIFSIIGIIITAVSPIGMLGEIRETILLLVVIGSAVMGIALVLLYGILIRQSTGALKTNALLGLVGILVFITGIIMDGQFFLALEAVPSWVKLFLAPGMTIGGFILWVYSRRPI